MRYVILLLSIMTFFIRDVEAGCDCTGGEYEYSWDFFSGSNCKDCPSGRYSRGWLCNGVDTCYECSSGKYSSSGSSSCTTCSTCKAGAYETSSCSATSNRDCAWYSGSCSNGELIDYESRTQEDHCGSCNGGYFIA